MNYYFHYPRSQRGGGGLSGPLLRRDAGDDGRRPADAGRRGRRASSRRETGWPPPAPRWTASSAVTAPPSARSTSRSTTSSARSSGVPVHELLGLPADLPPTDFTIGIDDARDRRAAGRSGRRPSRPSRSRSADPATSPRSRPSGPSTTVRSGSTPTRAGRWTARWRSCRTSSDSVWSSSSSRSRRAPTRTCSGGSRSGPRLPIVADESCVFPEDLDGLVGVVAGVNVKLAKCGGIGPARAMLERARELGLPDVPRLHGGDVGRDRRVGGRGVAGRLGRPGRLPAARRRPVRGARARPGHRWILPAGRVWA